MSRGGTELQACARANWSAVVAYTRHSRCRVTGRHVLPGIPYPGHTAQVLLGVASGGMDARALWRTNWSAVPATLPVLSLAFVYQNVVPVIASNLEVWLLPRCLLHRMNRLLEQTGASSPPILRSGCSPTACPAEALPDTWQHLRELVMSKPFLLVISTDCQPRTITSVV